LPLQFGQRPGGIGNEKLIKARTGLEDDGEFQQAVQGDAPTTLEDPIGRQGEPGTLRDLLLSPPASQTKCLDPTCQSAPNIEWSLKLYG
jgi:hypothetical protein